MLLKGNCLDQIKTLPDNSIDSIVTDPPYELGFMGKSWDASGIAYNADLWAQCLRVLKPGGHLLAFSGSRTYHRMVVAIEDSGFEIRDQIMWLYGSGFPKSLDVSKAIDKAAGAPVKVGKRFTVAGGVEAQPTPQGEARDEMRHTPATPEAQQWQGWGTALKPAHEPIVVARKPLVGTVANNVLTYGTGALNIDGSRVAGEKGDGNWKGVTDLSAKEMIYAGGWDGSVQGQEPTTSDGQVGRWPANVIHDGLDEDWAHFFYCAKASKSERDAGLETMPETQWVQWQTANGASGKPSSMSEGRDTKRRNIHPTVKPLALMRYLVKLVTPPNGIVLDPFLGSGTTAVAATLEGFDWIGCEMTEDYWPIIEARIEWAKIEAKKTPTTLF